MSTTDHRKILSEHAAAAFLMVAIPEQLRERTSIFEPQRKSLKRDDFSKSGFDKALFKIAENENAAINAVMKGIQPQLDALIEFGGRDTRPDWAAMITADDKPDLQLAYAKYAAMSLDGQLRDLERRVISAKDNPNDTRKRAFINELRELAEDRAQQEGKMIPLPDEDGIMTSGPDPDPRVAAVLEGVRAVLEDDQMARGKAAREMAANYRRSLEDQVQRYRDTGSWDDPVLVSDGMGEPVPAPEYIANH